MNRHVLRLLLLCAVSLGALASAEAAAHASITPANVVVTFHSTNPSLSIAGETYLCSDSHIAGSISPAGNGVSGILTIFTPAPFWCNGNRPLRPSCSGTVTLRATSSTTGVSIAGTVDLDTGYSCTIAYQGLACTSTFRGPQTSAGTWTFQQGTQELRMRLRTLDVTSSGFPCPATRTASADATYLVADLNRGGRGRITIS